MMSSAGSSAGSVAARRSRSPGRASLQLGMISLLSFLVSIIVILIIIFRILRKVAILWEIPLERHREKRVPRAGAGRLQAEDGRSAEARRRSKS